MTAAAGLTTTASRGKAAPTANVPAEANAACCISLPMFPELTAKEVDYVVAKVKEWDKKFASQAPAGKGPAQAGCCCCCK